MLEINNIVLAQTGYQPGHLAACLGRKSLGLVEGRLLESAYSFRANPNRKYKSQKPQRQHHYAQGGLTLLGVS